MQLALKEVEIRGGNGENHCFSYQIRNWNLSLITTHVKKKAKFLSLSLYLYLYLCLYLYLDLYLGLVCISSRKL